MPVMRSIKYRPFIRSISHAFCHESFVCTSFRFSIREVFAVVHKYDTLNVFFDLRTQFNRQNISQVCWYWKMLTESDQLWVPKCLRFGWNLNYIPTSFENGIWKQFYIENIKSLQYVPVKVCNTNNYKYNLYSTNSVNVDFLEARYATNINTKRSESSRLELRQIRIQQVHERQPIFEVLGWSQSAAVESEQLKSESFLSI